MNGYILKDGGPGWDQMKMEDGPGYGSMELQTGPDWSQVSCTGGPLKYEKNIIGLYHDHVDASIGLWKC